MQDIGRRLSSSLTCWPLLLCCDVTCSGVSPGGACAPLTTTTKVLLRLTGCALSLGLALHVSDYACGDVPVLIGAGSTALALGTTGELPGSRAGSK